MNPLTDLTLDQLRSRTSVKWTRYDADALPMWVAEMDVLLAPAIRETLERAIRDGDTGYPGSAPMIDAFGGFADRRWGWSVDGTAVQPVQSVITGYVDAFLLVTEPGEEIIVTPPVYPPFYSYLTQAGRVVREAPLTEELRLDFDALEEAFLAATAPREPGGPARSAGFLLCNPHNPGGAVHTRAELEAVAALAATHGVRVVSDEIHAPLVYSGSTFTPYTTVAGGETGLALHSASKAFNLAAMPGAMLVAGSAAEEWLATYRSGTHHWPTHYGTLTAAVAYAECDAWLDGLVAGLEENRDALAALVAETLPGVSVSHNQGTYLAWLDFRGTSDAGGPDLGDDPSEVLYRDGRVVLNPGPSFGTGGAGHARLNFATPPAVLQEGVRRIATVVAP